jgi:hypothetical protein
MWVRISTFTRRAASTITATVALGLVSHCRTHVRRWRSLDKKEKCNAGDGNGIEDVIFGDNCFLGDPGNSYFNNRVQ